MRILVVKLSSLGDIAQALPAVRRIAARTGATIDWVVQPEYAFLVAALPFVDTAIPFPRHRFLPGLPAFLLAVRRHRYDAVVDLQGLLKSAFAARCAPRRRGAKCYGPATAREGAGRFYHAAPPLRSGPRPHSAREMLDVADLLAPPPPDEAPLPPLRMDLPPLPFESSDHTGPRIVFTPFSRWPTKDWPPDAFAAVGRRLCAEYGARIRILGGPADVPAGQALAAATGSSVHNDCGRFSLLETCAVIADSDLLVGVDSGPLHWADALGIPLVAVYGATDPVRTGPFHQPESVIAAESLPCRPCHKRECARGDLACLATLSPDAVYRAACARL